MGRVRGVAVTAGLLLSQNKGDVERVVEVIGGTLRVPHMDSGRIREYLNGTVGSEAQRAEVLEMIALVGMPGMIQMGGDLEEKVAYGNHISTVSIGKRS